MAHKKGPSTGTFIFCFLPFFTSKRFVAVTKKSGNCLCFTAKLKKRKKTDWRQTNEQKKEVFVANLKTAAHFTQHCSTSLEIYLQTRPPLPPWPSCTSTARAWERLSTEAKKETAAPSASSSSPFSFDWSKLSPFIDHRWLGVTTLSLSLSLSLTHSLSFSLSLSLTHTHANTHTHTHTHICTYTEPEKVLKSEMERP